MAGFIAYTHAMIDGDGSIIISIGYEGKSVEELIALLGEHEVDVLVDVRENPISRKPGLSKRRFSELLSVEGIGYVHERSLGNPRDNRDAFRAGDAAARDYFEEHLDNGASEALRGVQDLAAEGRIALLCYEQDNEQCHRSLIIDRLHSSMSGLEIILV